MTQTVTSDLSLVLLDLDGTLVDSRALIVQCMVVAAQQTGVLVPPETAICRIIGLSLSRAIEVLFADSSPEVQVAVLQAYRIEALRLRADPSDPEVLFPGTRELILELREAGYLLGIATGKARRGVTHFCDRYDMKGWFDTIQTPDTNPSKPHPGMIESALAETGVDRGRVVMVGDTSFDLEMARNAGVFGVGVAWGNHPVSDLEEAGAHHIVEHMQGLSQAIHKLLEQGTGT